MAVVALTTIRHGAEDGTVTVVEEGDQLPAKVFTKDQLAELEENGSIGEPVVATPAATDEEKAALEARIAELEAELEAAKAGGK